MTPTSVALCGTFDVANFGDLLFPLVAEHELRARLGETKIVPYSYHGTSENTWPYVVRSLERLVDDISRLDLVIVGGGHLVRFDKQVAPGYRPGSEWIHHPTGYWLMPTLMAASAGLPVAWNAVQASRQTPAWAGNLMSAALASTSYVSVRDEPSLAELAHFAGNGSVHLVPDTVFGIRELVPAAPSDAFERLAAATGLVVPYVIVQPSGHLVQFARKIDRALREAIRAGCAVLELPISPDLGDAPGVVDLRTPTTRLATWPHPLLLAELIARSEAVIARSLHLSIVALAFGVPVHRLEPSPHSKYRALDGFQTVHWWRIGDDVARRLRNGLGRLNPEPAVERQVESLQSHWDAISGLVGAENADGRQAVAELFGHMTATLEVSALNRSLHGQVGPRSRATPSSSPSRSAKQR